MKRGPNCIKSAKTLLIVSLIFSGFLGDAQATQLKYRLTDLGAFTADGGSAAVDINNLGQITGYSWAPDQQAYAAIWNNGQISPLGGSAVWSYTSAINDSGVVVGYNHDGSNQNAIQWLSGQSSSILVSQTCCSGTASIAQDINNDGVVAGWSDGGWSAVTWTNGIMHKLPDLSYASAAMGINNFGQIVGISVSNTTSTNHAVMWNNGNIIDLGMATGFKASFAEKINDAGDVVGQSNNGYLADTHATLWRAGNIIDLGSLNDGADASFAKDINNLGQIIGYSQLDPSNPNSLSRAVIWSDSLVPIALDTLIDPLDPLNGKASLYSAWGINDLGQIVGYGLINGQQRAFLLNPISSVAEPENYALMMFGLSLISLARRRKATQLK